MRSTPFTWTCPFCARATTITDVQFKRREAAYDLSPSIDGNRWIITEIVVCPNPECRRLELTVGERLTLPPPSNISRIWPPPIGPMMHEWRLIPPSDAKVFPEYIPAQIRGDYTEACVIRELSPSASATLARRCLQGMIRDFWGITDKPNFYQEIQALNDRVDPVTWAAIDAVRAVGNIGAHMKNAVNLINEVDPGEAKQLTALIEVLLRDWYVGRHEREQQMRSLAALAEAKNPTTQT